VNGETIRDAAHLTTAILVSMGAVVGKASPLQLVVMTFFECIFYAINKRMLCMGVVDSVDGMVHVSII
jgi:ammonium transporter Rh